MFDTVVLRATLSHLNCVLSDFHASTVFSMQN